MACALLAIAPGAPAQSQTPAQSQAPAAAVPQQEACPRNDFRVVVDVGHTVAVPGAISARGVPEYAFNLQLGTAIKGALVAAGFTETTLLVTATAPWRGLVERAARANAMHANLFIAVHHDSVPDNLLKTWQYAGQDQRYNDDYPGYAIFISNDNADRAGSLKFGSLLGKELQARGLHYTPHYTLPLMGHRRRELVDAKAGVYRYDQLIVLRETRHAGGAAGGRIHRQPRRGIAVGKPRTPVAHRCRDRCGGRGFLRGTRGRRPTADASAKSPPQIAFATPARSGFCATPEC